MGVDLQLAHHREAKIDGVQSRLHLNWGAARLISDLLNGQGVLDHDVSGPCYSKTTSNDVMFELGNQRDPAELRWEAEQRVRFENLPLDEDVSVPALKFESNEGWLVFPAECATIGRALRATTSSMIQSVLEADENEMQAINNPEVEDPKDMPTAVSNVTEMTDSVAELYERAARFGGLRVF